MSEDPFYAKEFADRPGVVGTEWWQDSLEQVNPVGRRSALGAILGGAIALTTVGVIIGVATHHPAEKKEGDDDDFRTETKPALEMQKQYGWNFGAASEPLVFDGKSQSPFDKAALLQLPVDLSPRQAALLPFFVSTLLTSATAVRQTQPPGDPDVFTPLKDVLVPIFTPAMDIAYRRGQALAQLFDPNKPRDVSSIGVLVDLPGPEAVAFAAGAATAFDPVLLFDNWPHPRGVVPSHLALAACVYYQPLFARLRNGFSTPAVGDAGIHGDAGVRSTSRKLPPMFVVDRQRLLPYSDDSKQFDNRYVTKLPSAVSLARAGVTKLLYVTPLDSDRELDDLNDDFVFDVKHALPVKVLGAATFAGTATAVSTDGGTRHVDAGPSDAGAVSAATLFYGDGPATHEWFWNDYPWATAPKKDQPPTEPSFVRVGPAYEPIARPSAFSSGALEGTLTPPRPLTFGVVPVVIGVTTGVILGAQMSRSGSWTRSSSWGYG